MNCPCGDDLDYDHCCGRFHAGAEPPTAVRLMRARYCAFVRGDANFLIRTDHPMRRRNHDVRELKRSFALAWSGLEILATSLGGPDDAVGMVHFRASWRDGGVVKAHEERSRFSRVQGCWVYRDALGSPDPTTPPPAP